MKLLDLMPEFFGNTDAETGGWDRVETLPEAQHVFFLCPKCIINAPNPTHEGVHGIIVSFEGRNVPPGRGSKSSDGSDTRWNVSGTGFNDLTTTPSILIPIACGWHGFITNGEIINA